LHKKLLKKFPFFDLQKIKNFIIISLEVKGKHKTEKQKNKKALDKIKILC
jgi:hypothetical protein